MIVKSFTTLAPGFKQSSIIGVILSDKEKLFHGLETREIFSLVTEK
jgi:hypothetical protein